MAYLENKGFKYDVFISYAHIDDEGEGEEKWITRFSKKLKTTLEKLVGKPIEIWIDENNLRGNHAYDDEIREKIEQSAVFIMCSSNSYINSFYCKQEFNWFYSNAENSPFGVKVKNMLRISNVLLYDISVPDWASCVNVSSGYKVYKKQTSTSIGNPFAVNGEDFSNHIQLIAEDIKNVLQAIAETGSRKKVFFANVSKTLTDIKKRVITELTSQNNDIEIITEVPPPEEELEHDTKVKQILDEACLSVHLFNDLPGRDILGKPETFLQKQADLAISSGTPQLFWIPKNLKLTPDDVENNNHLNFLKKIEAGDYNKKSISYIRGVESEITREIQNKLKEVLAEKPLAVDSAVSKSEGVTLLLETHLKDYSTTSPMVEILVNNQIVPEINCESENQGNSLERLQDKMSKVNSFLTIIGNAPQTSFSRLDTCMQMMLNYEMKGKAIYLAPNLYSRLNNELQKKISIYKQLNFQILDDSHNTEFCPATFNLFIQTIMRQKEGASS